MSCFVPLYAFKLRLDLFGLLIIQSNNIIFTSCSEDAAIFFIVDSKDIIVVLWGMEDFFSIFTNVLVDMSIGISN